MVEINRAVRRRASRICRAEYFAAALLLCILPMGGQAAWAQAAPCTISQSFHLLDPGGRVRGSRGVALGAFRGCGKGTVTASTPGGSPLQIPLQFTSDGNNVEATFPVDPCRLPGGSDLPDARLTINLIAEAPARNQSYTAQLAADIEKPTLRMTSDPPSGSAVNAGDQIRIRMEASEDYGEARIGWQTGVQKIQLRDESLDRDVAPQHADGGPMRSCAQKAWTRRLEVTYTVPPNPPPVIRLRAAAWDFAGNKDDGIAEFATGIRRAAMSWHGTVRWTHHVVGRLAWATTTASADVSLVHDGQGGLTGTMSGRHEATSGDNCPGRTVEPGGIRASLAGSYAAGREPAMSIRAADKQTTPMRMQISCPGAPPVVSHHAGFYEFYEQALRGLRPTADGGFEATDRQVRPCEAGSTCTTTLSSRLHRTAQ